MSYRRTTIDAENSSALANVSQTTEIAARDVELVLSGGGIRASAFCLGVLLYLKDAALDQRIKQISSVSGGSITNGFVANFISEHGELTDEGVALFAKRLAREGMPLERFGRMFPLFLSCWALLTIGAATAIGFAFYAGDIGNEVVASVLWFGVALQSFYLYRYFRLLTDTLPDIWFAATINHCDVTREKWIRVVDMVSRSLNFIRRRMMSNDAMRVRPLRDVASPITHAFTATDLRNGEHIHFSQHWVTSNTYGSTGPGDVLVSEVVRASAAFPGALAPLELRLDRLNLPPHLTVGVRELNLVDGGVRDNLGHAFHTQLSAADDPQRLTLTNYGSITRLIVADASAPRGVADLSESMLASVPGLRRVGQLVTFPRVLSIMNQSNSEARSLALASHLTRTSTGFVVNIRESPVDVCRAAIDNQSVVGDVLNGRLGNPDDRTDRRSRAITALRALVRSDDGTQAYWNGICNHNQTIVTTLDALGPVRIASLIRHGYMATMCHAHIDLDWPICSDQLRTRERFAELVRARTDIDRRIDRARGWHA